MPQRIASVTTFSCSIPNCENTQFVVGDTPIQTITTTMGWVIDEVIFGETYDLCAEHADELRTWLHDE